MVAQNCPPDSELVAWLHAADDLPSDPSLTAHLETCSSCQNRLGQIDRSEDSRSADDELLADLRREVPPDPLETEAGIMGAGLRAASVFGQSSRADASLKSAVGDLRTLPDLGNYEILDVLGRGGMGVVYKARQIRANRTVALKMILHSRHASVQDQVRFQIEAEAVAHLQHPNIVQLYDVGEHENLPFFSLEYCDGGSLDQKLKTWTPTPAEAATLTETLSRAMHYAHLRGVVHRDLKPANVLLAADGTPKITDFGLAKKLDSNSDLSRSGAIMGTPSYMAPEQAEGKVHGTGPAADVYSLGALLYELLVGRPPFKGETPLETLQKVSGEEPVAPCRLRAGIPRDLETICLKCLRKQPGQRYASAEALADDLRRYQKGEVISARAVGRVERTVKWVRRQPTLAALLLVALLGVAGIVWQWQIAVENERIAKQLASEADARTEAERWERYRSNIAVIVGASQQQNFRAVRNNLESAPQEYRGWEWKYFASQLDGARNVLEVGTGDFTYCPVFDVCPTHFQIAFHRPDGSPAWWDPSAGDETGFAGPHTRPASWVAYSPDGKRLAVAADDNRIHVWDVHTRQRICRLDGHQKQVVRLVFSPDGKRLASGGFDPEVRVWDLTTGACIRLPQNTVRCTGLAFTPDGTRLVYASEKELVCVRVGDGQTVVAYKGHTGLISDIAVSPDGDRLASASQDPANKIRLWDLATGEQQAVLSGHEGEISGVAFSPDGKRLASSSLDRSARIWDAKTGDLLHVLAGHTAGLYSLAYSPDGTRLLTGSADETVRLWDADSGKPLAVLRGHRSEIPEVAFSHDGGKIVTAAFDGTIRIWDVRAVESAVLRGHQRYVYDVAFHPNGNWIASSAWDGTVRLWDVATGMQVREMTPAGNIVPSVMFDGTGERLLTLSRFGENNLLGRTVTAWSTASGEPLWKHHLTDSDWKNSRAVFSPGGDLVAVGDSAGPVRLLDAASGTELATLQGHANEVWDVAFHPSGSRLASAGADATIRLWDLVGRTGIAVLHGHKADVIRLAYSPDGKRLASSAKDKTVRLWDGETHQLVAELPQGHTVYGLAFSPNGTRLAAGCDDGTIRLWDLTTFQEVAELRGHQAYVHAVAFSPDGTRLVSGSGDWTVRVWDTLSTRERLAGSAARPTDPSP